MPHGMTGCEPVTEWPPARLSTGWAPGDQRHAQPHEEHEEERDAGRGALLGGGVDVAVAHDHARHEGRQQHLDVDAVLGAVEVLGYQIDRLRGGEDHHGVTQHGLPVLPHVVVPEPPPAEGEQHDDHQQHGEELPAHPYHHNLQRYHQQDGVQVVEDGQHLNLAVNPARLEAQRRQHREEDAGRGGGRKAAQQQVLLPRLGRAPEVGGEQHEDE